METREWGVFTICPDGQVFRDGVLIGSHPKFSRLTSKVILTRDHRDLSQVDKTWDMSVNHIRYNSRGGVNGAFVGKDAKLHSRL